MSPPLLFFCDLKVFLNKPLRAYYWREVERTWHMDAVESKQK